MYTQQHVFVAFKIAAEGETRSFFNPAPDRLAFFTPLLDRTDDEAKGAGDAIGRADRILRERSTIAERLRESRDETENAFAHPSALQSCRLIVTGLKEARREGEEEERSLV